MLHLILLSGGVLFKQIPVLCLANQYLCVCVHLNEVLVHPDVLFQSEGHA